VFTAGVGENAPLIRTRIAELCAWLGVRLNTAANLSGARDISGADSTVKVLVIPTDEQVVIARGVASLLRAPL
jgi:acetate kinase